MAALTRPRRIAFSVFWDFFLGRDPAGGGGGGSAVAAGSTDRPLLLGRGRELTSQARSEYVCAADPGRARGDLLSRFLRDHWPWHWHRRRGDADDDESGGGGGGVATMTHHLGGAGGHVAERRIAAAVGGISAVVAMFLLIGAVVSLYVVTEPDRRLAMIGCYTVLFAAAVAVMTSARRAEVFAATAAYTAVLVVFVSGDLGSGGPRGKGGMG